MRVVRLLSLLPIVLVLPACEELPAAPDVPNEPPRPSFFYTPVAPIYSGATVVSFDAQGTRDLDGQVMSYEWSFGDGTRQTDEHDHHHPRLHGHGFPLPEHHLRRVARCRRRPGRTGGRFRERHRHRASRSQYPRMPTLKKTRMAAVVVGALFASAPLPAQPLPAPPSKKALPRHKLGPIHVSPQFRLVSGIDTNVFQTFGDPTRDAVTVLSPRLDGVLPVGRRLRISGFGAMDFFYFRRQDDERSTDFEGEGRAELDSWSPRSLRRRRGRAVHAKVLDRRGRPPQAPAKGRLRRAHLAGEPEALYHPAGGERRGDVRPRDVPPRG